MAAEDRPHADPAPERVTQALRGWLHDGVALLRVRLELFGVEAREHALASVELLLAGLAALLFLGLGLGFFAVLLTVLLWDSHRLLALAVIWEVYGRWLNNPLLFPSFSETVQAFGSGISSGVLLQRAASSLQTLLVGYGLGIGLAALLTTVAISSRIGTTGVRLPLVA